MHLEFPHALGKEKAIRRIERGIEDLRLETLPAAVELKDFSKTRKDNLITLSLRASKRRLSATISAIIFISESAVDIEIEVPAMLKVFVSERLLAEGVKAHVAPLLS